MPRFSLASSAAVAALAASSAFAQGDPEAATAILRGRPTKSWEPWQPKPTYALNQLPDYYMGENRAGNGIDQSGWNVCAQNAWNQESRCQTAWINSLEDWCIWGPPEGGDIGSTERVAVAFCTTDKHGTRLIPDGTITGAHFVQTSSYVQITGTGDFTKIGLPAGDQGGEMDSHGADDLSNPVGGVVYTTANPATNGQPFFVSEWTNFMSHNQYCMRACWGNDARERCQHIYDVLGCQWNLPANYSPDQWESCDGDLGLVQGVYEGSTFMQGDPVTPPAHPAPASSNCRTASSLAHGLLLGGYPSYSSVVGAQGSRPEATTRASASSTTASSSSSSSSTSTSSSSMETSTSSSSTSAAPTTTAAASSGTTSSRAPSATNNQAASTNNQNGAAAGAGAPLAWVAAAAGAVLAGAALL